MLTIEVVGVVRVYVCMYVVAQDEFRARAIKPRGNLRAVIKQPTGKPRCVWLTENIAELANEAAELYSFCFEDAKRFKLPGQGFPQGVEYRWAGKGMQTARRMSSPGYVEAVFVWLDGIFADERLCSDTGLKDDTLLEVYTKLFRVFAIIYHHHLDVVETLGVDDRLNGAFRCLVFVGLEAATMPSAKDVSVLHGPVDRLRDQYEKARKADEALQRASDLE